MPGRFSKFEKLTEQSVVTQEIPVPDIILDGLVMIDHLQFMKLNENRRDLMRHEMVGEPKERDRLSDTSFTFDHQVILSFPFPAVLNNFTNFFNHIGIIGGFDLMQFKIMQFLDAIGKQGLIDPHQPETRM